MKVSTNYKDTNISVNKNWNTSLVNDFGRRRSELCKAKDFKTGWYKRWCTEINEVPRLHRKQWEYAYIAEALWERNCIRKNKKGLVFAVGNEPLPSAFAKYGCSIIATDIHPEEGEKLGWADSHELCYGLDSLNKRGICPDQVFKEKVKYAAVDMNHIPKNLKGFDFNWSSCSFEHLGSIEKGLNFLKNQIDTLNVGGWAVHTTEFNISSDDVTIDRNENTVIFRRRDIENVIEELRALGHFVEEVDYSLGGLPEDFHVDTFPYQPDNHIRLQLDKFIVTSIGLIIQKKKFRKRTFWFLSGKD